VEVSSALAAKYVDVATTGLVFYDWSIGLSDEIEFVWASPSRSKLPKYIFIVLRYCTLAAQPISLLFDFLQITSGQLCKSLVRSIVALTFIVIVSTEWMIMLRLLTAYRGNKLIYWSFWILYTLFVAASTVFMVIWGRDLRVVTFFAPGPMSEPLDILPGCWSAFGGRALFVPFGIVIAWEIVISIMTIWKTWRNFVRTGTPFWELFYRDGDHFYLWILAISFVDVGLAVLFTLHHTSVIQDRILFSLERTVHSVCLARLIFHVRRLGTATDSETKSHEFSESLQLMRSNAIDKPDLTTPINGGKRLRETWEEIRKQRKESVIIQVEDELPTSRTSYLFTPNSESAMLRIASEDTPISNRDAQLERNMEDPSREREFFREWLLRVNADMAS